MLTLALSHTERQTRAHARSRTRTHARAHASTHTRTHACIHTHARGRTSARAHAHTYTRTHTHKLLSRALFIDDSWDRMEASLVQGGAAIHWVNTLNKRTVLRITCVKPEFILFNMYELLWCCDSY